MISQKYESVAAARMAAAKSLSTDVRTEASFSVLAQAQPQFDESAEAAAREALRPYLEDEGYSSVGKE